MLPPARLCAPRTVSVENADVTSKLPVLVPEAPLRPMSRLPVETVTVSLLEKLAARTVVPAPAALVRAALILIVPTVDH